MSGDKKDAMKKGPRRSEVHYEFNNIKFTSQPSDTFRATVNTVTDGVKLWLENKSSKSQWLETVKDVAECGLAGVPEDAVVAFLKRAFERVMIGSEISNEDKNEPDLDLQMTGGEAILTLTVSMGGIWRPKFVFALLPVGLDKLDIIEAKLRDAQEEIEVLKSKAAEADGLEVVRFFSVSSQTACGQQQIVQWDAPAPREVPKSLFRLSADHRKVTIVTTGVYQVHVRLGGTNTGNTQFMALQLNGADVAQCTQSDANSHQNSPQVTEIMRLKERDVLQVMWGGNNSSLTVANANRFTILLLGK